MYQANGLIIRKSNIGYWCIIEFRYGLENLPILNLAITRSILAYSTRKNLGDHSKTQVLVRGIKQFALHSRQAH